MNGWTDIALVVFTAVLAAATIVLARYTKTLSKLTGGIVRIESARDRREMVAKRLRDLERGYAAAIIVQQLNPPLFAKQLTSRGKLPATEMRAIETLYFLRSYLEDPDCDVPLNSLCGMFDTVRQAPETMLDTDDIARKASILKSRIQWFIDGARLEIANAQKLEDAHAQREE